MNEKHDSMVAVRTVTKTSNKVFDFRNLSLFRFVLTPLNHVLIASGLHVGIVVTTIVLQCFVRLIQTNNVGTDIVHEILGVTHKKQNTCPIRQIIFQPHDGFHIQMVGGLVQQKTVI